MCTHDLKILNSNLCRGIKDIIANFLISFKQTLLLENAIMYLNCELKNYQKICFVFYITKCVSFLRNKVCLREVRKIAIISLFPLHKFEFIIFKS